MRLIIAAVGRLKAGPDRELFLKYAERLTPAGSPSSIGPFSSIEINESKAKTAAERKKAEGKQLIDKCPAGAHLVSLDEKGRTYTSGQFADYLKNERLCGTACLAFLIGGADGLADAVKSKSSQTLSLGPMTFPHGLVRIILAEQIYRGLTILSGHPYHRK